MRRWCGGEKPKIRRAEDRKRRRTEKARGEASVYTQLLLFLTSDLPAAKVPEVDVFRFFQVPVSRF